MRKVAVAFGTISLIYVLLFFLWAPVYMIGLTYNQYWLMKLTSNYDAMAYRSWVSKLDVNNPLIKIRYKNTMYWCNKFERCHTDENS